jgi:hypothetical protein
MSIIHWIKEHFELLTAAGLGIGGVGKVVHTQGEHDRKIIKLEECHAAVKEDLSEIKGDIKTLLERTKHL